MESQSYYALIRQFFRPTEAWKGCSDMVKYRTVNGVIKDRQGSLYVMPFRYILNTFPSYKSMEMSAVMG